MTAAGKERAVVLAATTAPLRLASGSWYRTDGPGSVPQQLTGAEHATLGGLLELGWLGKQSPSELCLTSTGLAAARDIREGLGRERRQLLERIDAAGELVRRVREATDEEYCTILASGDPAADQIEEWVAPRRTAPAQGYPTVICDGLEMAQLLELGLVVLLAGGTRAVLTGAGRWCAAGKAPSSHADGSGDGEATDGASGEETASEGAQEPGRCFRCDGPVDVAGAKYCLPCKIGVGR